MATKRTVDLQNGTIEGVKADYVTSQVRITISVPLDEITPAIWAFVRGNGVQSQIATNILRLHDNDHEAALAELIAAKEQTLEPAG